LFELILFTNNFVAFFILSSIVTRYFIEWIFLGIASPADGEFDGVAGLCRGGDVRLLGIGQRSRHHLRFSPCARHTGT